MSTCFPRVQVTTCQRRKGPNSCWKSAASSTAASSLSCRRLASSAFSTTKGYVSPHCFLLVHTPFPPPVYFLDSYGIVHRGGHGRGRHTSPNASQSLIHSSKHPASKCWERSGGYEVECTADTGILRTNWVLTYLLLDRQPKTGRRKEKKPCHSFSPPSPLVACSRAM